MRGRLARNTLLATFWQAVRVGGQAVWVIVIARSMGPAGLGVLAGLSGLATSLGGLTGLGSAMLLLKRVSQDHAQLARHWRQALVVTAGSGALLALSFAALAPSGGAPLRLVGAVAFSELLCFPMVVMCSLAFQAQERLGWCTALSALGALARLVAAAAFWVAAPAHDLEHYAAYHAGAAAVAALVAYGAVRTVLRPAAHAFRWTRAEAVEGLSFSTLWFTSNATTEFDKTLALRFGGGEVAGVYSAAYRFATMLTLPIASLVMAAQPRLFRGGGEITKLLRHALVAILGWSIVGAVLLQGVALLVPVLLGPQFAASSAAARWLALMLPCYGLRLLGTSVLTAYGRQALRACVEVSGIAAMSVAGLLLIPRYGVDGAVAMIVGAEAVLALLSWTLVLRVQRG